MKLKQYVQEISQILTTIHTFPFSRPLPQLEIPFHPFRMGVQVLLKLGTSKAPEQQVELKWKEPYDVLLMSHTSL
jgi:hypothetical protein